MNYVQHTRAAHEQLLAHPESRPHHFTLYWALFFAWNSARFPAALPLNRDELMAASRIGNRDTYTAALRTLEAFGLLIYQPSHRTNGSRVLMTELTGEVAPQVSQPKASGCPTSEATAAPEVAAPVGQPVAAQPGQPSPEVAAQVSQHSLLSKTVDVNSIVNSAAAPEKKRGKVFSDDGLSGAEILDDTAPPDGAVPDPGAAPKKKVAPKKQGVQAETIRAAATAQATEPRRQSRGRQNRPETTFQESAIYPKDKFIAAFEGTDYALADLNHYHEAVNLWRDKITGELPRRADWIATAKRFMFNDATDNRLKLAPGVQRHEPGNGTSSGTANPGASTTGYRSRRWDS